MFGWHLCCTMMETERSSMMDTVSLLTRSELAVSCRPSEWVPAQPSLSATLATIYTIIMTSE